MARQCSHMDDGICKKCIDPLSPRPSGIFSAWGVIVNETFIKRSALPDMTDRHAQMLAEDNRIWMVAPNGIKIDPLLL